MSEPVNLKFPQPQKPKVKPIQGESLRLVWLIGLVLVFVGVGVAFYSYGKRAAVSEMDTIVNDVGAHLMLPEGTPRIGKISDISQFTKDPFLSQALVDDVVLFYPHDGRTVKAILWRPSTQKIVDVALVTLPDITGVK